MDAVERLRSRNRFEETLPSGLTVTLRLPQIHRCIAAGGVPLPVIQHVTKVMEGNGDTPPLDAEGTKAMNRYQDELVRQSVVAIEGEPVELSLEDVKEFRSEDFRRIAQLAGRDVPSPLAQT